MRVCARVIEREYRPLSTRYIYTRHCLWSPQLRCRGERARESRAWKRAPKRSTPLTYVLGVCVCLVWMFFFSFMEKAMVNEIPTTKNLEKKFLATWWYALIFKNLLDRKQGVASLLQRLFFFQAFLFGFFSIGEKVFTFKLFFQVKFKTFTLQGSS